MELRKNCWKHTRPGGTSIRILAIGELDEQFTYLERLAEVMKSADVEGVVFASNIRCRGDCSQRHPERPQRKGEDEARVFNRFFAILGSFHTPAYLVPGKNDAPERVFLQAPFNNEIIAAGVYTVQRGFPPLGRNYVVSGWGGEINDGKREAESFLLYPSSEPEFSLDFLRHLDQDRILVFHTPPAEKSDGSTPGKRHQAVSHQIKTYRPQFAICCRNESVAGKLTVAAHWWFVLVR